MGLMHVRTSWRRIFAGAAVLLGALGSAAAAQEPAPEFKEPPDSAKLAKWKAEAEALPLFASHDPITFTLVGNFKNISKDRDTLSKTEYWGELRLANGADTSRIPVQLRTRGHYRLSSRNCGFVPLRVDFKTKEVAGTIFEGQDKLKLITHCNENSLYDDYILREYAVYRVHNVITPRSFRVRLAKVTYVDSATNKPVTTRNAVFLEHEDHVAHRMEGEIVEIRRALFADVEMPQITEVSLFQYFIGNTDWSLSALHNIRLVRKLDGTLYPINYDVDFSGLVGTRYSTPDPRMNIRTVKERKYRGPCRTPEELEPFLAVYREKEADVYKVYDSIPGMDSRYVSEAKKYLKDFFDMIKRPRDVKFNLVESCEKLGT